jgi:hypothetical protein
MLKSSQIAVDEIKDLNNDLFAPIISATSAV